MICENPESYCQSMLLMILHPTTSLSPLPSFSTYRKPGCRRMQTVRRCQPSCLVLAGIVLLSYCLLRSSAFSPVSTTRRIRRVPSRPDNVNDFHLAPCPFIGTTHPLSRPWTSTTSLFVYDHVAGIDSQLLFDTWEWNANLASPAALVAGAVLATLIDGREYMSVRVTDKRWVRHLKKSCRLLLLSSFGLEVVSIFVTVVMGTLLLSVGDVPSAIIDTTANSPMGLMQKNFEFEYLTARITFLQGLFNWLASVALEILIPRRMEGQSTRRMNRFISSALMTIIIAMLSFLNRHVVFYENYTQMLKRFAVLSISRFIWPLKPLTAVFVPALALTTFFGYRAFISPPDDVEEEDGRNI